MTDTAPTAAATAAAPGRGRAAQAEFAPETTYLSTAAVGLPPRSTVRAVQDALCTWQAGRGVRVRDRPGGRPRRSGPGDRGQRHPHVRHLPRLGALGGAGARPRTAHGNSAVVSLSPSPGTVAAPAAAEVLAGRVR